MSPIAFAGTFEAGPEATRRISVHIASDCSRFPGDGCTFKATMVESLSLTTQGYKDKHPSFPDQTTVDQFFEPEQFAAYRELGYVIGADAVEKIRQLTP